MTRSLPTTPGEAQDALGYQLRMFDKLYAMRYHAREDYLALWQVDILPDLPLMLVPWVRRFK